MPNRKRLLVTGGTGFIGRALLKSLLEEYQVLALTRDPAKAKSDYNHPELTWLPWPSPQKALPKEAKQNIYGVIHLAGENIAAQRWDDEIKKKLRESRIFSTRQLVHAFNEEESKPKFFLSASAIGYYGAGRHGDLLKEDDKPGKDFLAQLCQEWEKETLGAQSFARVVVPRFGVVLGLEGGALQKMLPFFRMGAGGKIGDGEQIMSWIYLGDLVRFILFAAQNESIKGIYNLCSPNPVTNKEFTNELGKALHRPTFIPIPKSALKLLYGELAPLTLFASQKADTTKLRDAGFQWLTPEIRTAVKNSVGAK